MVCVSQTLWKLINLFLAGGGGWTAYSSHGFAVLQSTAYVAPGVAPGVVLGVGIDHASGDGVGLAIRSGGAAR